MLRYDSDISGVVTGFELYTVEIICGSCAGSIDLEISCSIVSENDTSTFVMRVPNGNVYIVLYFGKIGFPVSIKLEVASLISMVMYCSFCFIVGSEKCIDS